MVGVTGNTGAATATALLERGASIRVVVRDPEKARPWSARGAEVAVADLADPGSLARAFQGARGAYVLNPPAYTMTDIFERASLLAGGIREAALKSGLPRLVVLSSIGAHLSHGSGNVRTNAIFERVLEGLPGQVVFLRPAYFMENWAWVAAAAAQQGILPSFLAPADRAIPMVSAPDIGRAAAEALLDGGGAKVVEFEGPRPCSPDDVAAAFSKALGRPVSAIPVPESEWPGVLAATGFSPATISSWVELFRGFNSGWIAFERPETVSRGQVAVEEAAAAIVRGK